MATIPFDQLPDDARLWVFGSDRPLSPDEERRVLDSVDRFLGTWAAHGAELTCAREWRYGRFLMVGVDERSVPPSGCSIDAMVRVLKELEAALAVSLVDGAPVFYRADADRVERAGRAAFRELASAGRVSPDTVIFDGTVTRVGQLRSGEWEKPAHRSWHGKTFFAKS